MIPKCKGFTLIELLIVVAIIAILAAIAVPNFLEAQVRVKVSRGKNDMRSLATALESYKVDTNKYPQDYQFYQGSFPPITPPADPNNQFAMCCLGRLTTPVAYMTSLPYNAFKFKSFYDGDPRWYGYKSEECWRSIVSGGILTNPNATSTGLWVLISAGPDQKSSGGEYAMFGEKYVITQPPTDAALAAQYKVNGPAIYDPTNGTMSDGDITRVGP